MTARLYLEIFVLGSNRILDVLGSLILTTNGIVYFFSPRRLSITQKHRSNVNRIRIYVERHVRAPLGVAGDHGEMLRTEIMEFIGGTAKLKYNNETSKNGMLSIMKRRIE